MALKEERFWRILASGQPKTMQAWGTIGTYEAREEANPIPQDSSPLNGDYSVGGLLATVIYNGPREGVYLPVYDGNGNVMGYVRAADGVWVAQYEYGPFGELLRATGPLAQSFHHLFSTKYHDCETGLYYYGHRYYSPTTGRWLSRDPAEEKGGTNLYVFVNNNTLTYVDINGLGLLDLICNYSETAANARGLNRLNEQARRHGYVDYNEAIKVLNERHTKVLYTPASPETTQVAAQLANAGANAILSGPVPEIQAATGGTIAAYNLLRKMKCCKSLASENLVLKLSASAADKMMLKNAKPDFDAFIGIIRCTGEIRLFKAGENGIYGHADLVRSKMASVGDTLGFSVGKNKDGRIEIINMSELNVHLGLGGTLPDEVICAIKEALK